MSRLALSDLEEGREGEHVWRGCKKRLFKCAVEIFTSSLSHLCCAALCVLIRCTVTL